MSEFKLNVDGVYSSVNDTSAWGVSLTAMVGLIKSFFLQSLLE
jgi:hypothetical protein